MISVLFSLTATAYLLTLGILTATSRMGCSNTERLSLTSQLMNESVLRRNRFAATRIPSVSEAKRKRPQTSQSYISINSFYQNFLIIINAVRKKIIKYYFSKFSLSLFVFLSLIISRIKAIFSATAMLKIHRNKNLFSNAFYKTDIACGVYLNCKRLCTKEFVILGETT